MLYWVIIFIILNITEASDEDAKSFGSIGPFSDLKVTNEHLSSKYFYDNHVQAKKPLLMRGIAKEFKAFGKWSDRFLGGKIVNYDKNYEIYVQRGKKETRSQDSSMMKMSEFLSNYRGSDLYMVSSVPDFLKSDVPLPSVLQCGDASNILERTIMWFSDGGTKSVVHIDDWDNILCVLEGSKKVFLVDSFKYKQIADIILDSSDGTYSTIDVDNVDFTKIPGIWYYKAHLNAGDCIFIPSKFIHQVNSFDRNIAVNFWFNYKRVLNTDFLNNCLDTNKFNPEYTLDTINYDNPNEWIRSFIVQDVAAGNRDLISWIRLFTNKYRINENASNKVELRNFIQEMFDVMDYDGDGNITDSEIIDVDENRFELISNIFIDFHQAALNHVSKSGDENHYEL